MREKPTAVPSQPASSLAGRAEDLQSEFSNFCFLVSRRLHYAGLLWIVWFNIMNECLHM